MESSTTGILGHRNHTWFAGQFPHVFRSFSQPKRKLDLVQGFPIYPFIPKFPIQFIQMDCYFQLMSYCIGMIFLLEFSHRSSQVTGLSYDGKAPSLCPHPNRFTRFTNDPYRCYRFTSNIQIHHHKPLFIPLISMLNPENFQAFTLDAIDFTND